MLNAYSVFVNKKMQKKEEGIKKSLPHHTESQKILSYGTKKVRRTV